MSRPDISDSPAFDTPSNLSAAIARLIKLQAYPVPTTLSDWPRWAWLSQVRIIGPLVVFARELLAFINYHWRVRRPWLQQIEFNAEVVTALKLINRQANKLASNPTADAEISEDEFYELQLDLDDRLYAFQLTIDQQAHALQQCSLQLQAHLSYIQELQAENARLRTRVERLATTK